MSPWKTIALLIPREAWHHGTLLCPRDPGGTKGRDNSVPRTNADSSGGWESWAGSKARPLNTSPACPVPPVRGSQEA